MIYIVYNYIYLYLYKVYTDMEKVKGVEIWQGTSGKVLKIGLKSEKFSVQSFLKKTLKKLNKTILIKSNMCILVFVVRVVKGVKKTTLNCKVGSPQFFTRY